MKNHRTIFFLLACVGLLRLDAFAQCKDNAFQRLDVNKVSARFNNGGHYFWDMYGNNGYLVPVSSGRSPAFAGSIWVGGLDGQGGLHVAAGTYRLAGQDWYSGPMRAGTPYDCETTITANSLTFYRSIKRLSNGKILVLTEDEVLIHDELTLQTISRPLPSPRQWVDAIELPDGRIFLLGDDFYPTKNPSLFMDTVNYTITGGPTLNWFHQGSSLDLLDNGKVLIAGVVGCEVFDPSTNISTNVPGMIWARTKHATVKLANGDIFACGGGSSIGGSGYTLFTQRFDDTLGYWFPGPALNVGRQRAAMVTMPDGRLFICGGTLNSPKTQFYDPIRDSLINGPDLPDPIAAASVHALDSVWVIIAAEDPISITGNLIKFNTQTGEYHGTHLQRSGARSLLLNAQEILIDVIDRKHLQRINFETGVQDDDRWQKIWKVDRREIDQFRADFLANDVDFSRYRDIEIWPAHGDVQLGEDRVLAPFVDVNGDGLYRPLSDGDYPCIVGDQALWWVINDQGPHLESNGVPFGLQLECMAYAFDCSRTPCPDSSVDYSTFLHVELSNHGDSAYHDMYVSEYQDIDLGAYDDDFVACDTALQLAIGFNGDDEDANYGIHPPAWGIAVLPNGQIDAMSAFLHYENTFVGPNSNPNRPADFYNFMQGRWRDSTQMVDNGLQGLPSQGAGNPTRFQYPSTDGFCTGNPTGWSEISAGNAPFDRSFVQSCGPFSLAPRASKQWDLAYVYARGSDYLQSVCALKDATASIRDWWGTQLDRSCWSTLVATASPEPSATLRIVPNPVGGHAFTVDFGAALQEVGQLELIDLNGRVLLQKRLDWGAEQEVVDATELPAGVYIVRVLQPGAMRAQRVVVW